MIYLHLGCGVGLTNGFGVGPPGCGCTVGIKKLLVGLGVGVGGLQTGILQQASLGSMTRRQYVGTFK